MICSCILPKQGWKEAERFIYWGCQQSLPRLDPEADNPTIKLVGYQTSHKEIRDLYHNVYLLRRSPGPLPCRPQQREEAIQDILSPLRSCLHQWGCTAMPEEDLQGAAGANPLPVCQWESQFRSRKREDPHDEAHWESREAQQWALEATHVLECNIERLSQGVEGAQYTCPHSYSSSCPHSKSLDRHERSQNIYKRSPSWHRLERWVTFWDPEVELDSSERPYRGPWGHSFRTHLKESDGVPPTHPKAGNSTSPGDTYSLSGCQKWRGLSAWAINQELWSMPGLVGLPVRHPTLVGGSHHHPQCGEPKEASPKIHDSFSIPVVRCESLPGQDYTVPPCPQMSHQGSVFPQWSILSGHPMAAPAADHGLCLSATVLGREN